MQVLVKMNDGKLIHCAFDTAKRLQYTGRKKLLPSVHKKFTTPGCRLMTCTRAHVQIDDIHTDSTPKNLICAYDYHNNTSNDGVGVVSGDVLM